MRAWNTSGYSLFVTWKIPANVNGKLKGYKVYRVGAVLSVHVFITKPAISSKLAFELSIPIFQAYTVMEKSWNSKKYASHSWKCHGIRTICLGHGKVVEFQIFPKLFLVDDSST